MNRTPFLAVALACWATAANGVTVDDIFADIKIEGTRPGFETLSPDERWVAYAWNADGRDAPLDLYIAPVAGGAARAPDLLPSGCEVRFAARGACAGLARFRGQAAAELFQGRCTRRQSRSHRLGAGFAAAGGGRARRFVRQRTATGNFAPRHLHPRQRNRARVVARWAALGVPARGRGVDAGGGSRPRGATDRSRC